MSLERQNNNFAILNPISGSGGHVYVCSRGYPMVLSISSSSVILNRYQSVCENGLMASL